MSTNTADVPPITNDDVTLSPRAYADNVSRSAKAAAAPTIMTKPKPLADTGSPELVFLTTSSTTILTRNAVPVMTAAPSAGWMLADARRRKME